MLRHVLMLRLVLAVVQTWSDISKGGLTHHAPVKILERPTGMISTVGEFCPFCDQRRKYRRF